MSLPPGEWRRHTQLVRALEATIPVEIEVDTLDGLRAAIEAGADEVLLDNFDLETTRAAVAYRDEHAPRFSSKRVAVSRSRSPAGWPRRASTSSPSAN